MEGSKDPIHYSGFHPDHRELIRYFRKNRVYTVQIESNLACQQGCQYCYASSDYDIKKELPTEVVRKVLDSATNIGARSIDWLGGDPLLRDNWYELMMYAMRLGLKNNIWTSGIPLSKMETAKKAVKASEGGFISVHLDTLDEELYRRLHTGNPSKKINTIIRGVENIIFLGKPPGNIFNCITFTGILAGEDIRRTIAYFSQERGIRTCLTQMCRVGGALEYPEWIPTIEEIQEAVGIRDSLDYQGSEASMSTMDANKYYCGGAICVTIDGDVTPCSVIRKGFGNVVKKPLEEIIEEHRDALLYTELRDTGNLPGSCSTCQNNSVCWGCRASAFYDGGDMLGRDPKCWLNQK